MNTADEIEIILTNLRQALRALEERTGPLVLDCGNGVIDILADTGHGRQWHNIYRTEDT